MIKIGCQTYTWEMLGDKWKGSVDDILEAMSKAGYQGIEISANMIGKYYDRPEDFSKALKKYNLELAALAFSSQFGFSDPKYEKEELIMARRALEFVSYFPCRKIGVGGAANPSRENYETKFKQFIKMYNQIGEMGKEMGTMVCVHPHSHYGSLLETAEEYDRLMQEISPDYVMFGPDTGHIVRGEQNLLNTIRKHVKRIKHIHFKDVDTGGNWKLMGKGVCNFPEILKLLKEANYDGWIICEEESKEAYEDQFKAIKKNREYMKKLGY